LTGLAFASFLAFGALLVLFGANGSELITALELDYADLGLVGSCLSLGLGVGIVVAGPLIDRLPRRPLYVGACVGVFAACALLGPATDFRTLLVHTVAIGLGAGFYETVLNALVVERFGDGAPRRLVFFHSAATLSAAATPLAFEALRGIAPIAWYDTFRLVGALHLLLLAAVAFVPMQAGPRQAARGGTPSDAIGGHGAAARGAGPDAREDRLAFAAICVAIFAYVGVESALTLFVADHARANLGLDAARAAGTISAFWSGLLVGRLAVGFAPRAPGSGTTALLAAIAAAVVLGFGRGWIGPPELAMAATGFFLGGVFPVMVGLAGRALPRTAGLAVGLAGGLGSLGGFVVPWITGELAKTGGLPAALTTLAGWLALLVAGAAYARLRRGRTETDPGGPGSARA